jgi:hypothetical protein
MVRKILYFSVCVVLLLNLACLKVSANDDQAYDFEYILENECEPNKQEDGSVIWKKPDGTACKNNSEEESN